ncbi:hypothetical protein PF002_g6403 [Phytophthora fragariae]|uniref:Uncharacterized protein n=1 Tax=Phytophthora fragariae TaxID=53985 RepID=A0A6A3E653_9STRA|nr:hypothetical protein PF009_g22489 [Phytophthora fragariae]KAE9102373.1 hypothetical protein PF007_g14790 [Phytophthora fragariae]KAE9247165.1 hypothetical protein PF002_g6403 [Phytophthora fragariae]
MYVPTGPLNRAPTRKRSRLASISAFSSFFSGSIGATASSSSCGTVCCPTCSESTSRSRTYSSSQTAGTLRCRRARRVGGDHDLALSVALGERAAATP